MISVLTPTPSRVNVPSATNETKQDLCWTVSIKKSAKRIYYANRAHTPSKLRAFIEFMQAVKKVPK